MTSKHSGIVADVLRTHLSPSSLVAPLSLLRIFVCIWVLVVIPYTDAYNLTVYIKMFKYNSYFNRQGRPKWQMRQYFVLQRSPKTFLKTPFDPVFGMFWNLGSIDASSEQSRSTLIPCIPFPRYHTNTSSPVWDPPESGFLQLVSKFNARWWSSRERYACKLLVLFAIGLTVWHHWSDLDLPWQFWSISISWQIHCCDRLFLESLCMFCPYQVWPAKNQGLCFTRTSSCTLQLGSIPWPFGIVCFQLKQTPGPPVACESSRMSQMWTWEIVATF